MQGRALAVGSLLLAAAIAGSTDATASRPAIAIVVGPTVQTLQTRVVARVDARTRRVVPALRFGTARFTVTVTNPGAATLSGVEVGAPDSPGCARAIGTLAPGASLTYRCSASGVARDYANRVRVSGSTPDGTRTLASAAVVRVALKPPKRTSHVPPPVYQQSVRRSHVPTLPFTG